MELLADGGENEFYRTAVGAESRNTLLHLHRQEGVVIGGKPEFRRSMRTTVHQDFFHGKLILSRRKDMNYFRFLLAAYKIPEFKHCRKIEPLQVINELSYNICDINDNRSIASILLIFHVRTHAGCLDDVRLNGRLLPLPGNSSEVGAVSVARGVSLLCLAPPTCLNLTCIAPFTCQDNWRENFCGSVINCYRLLLKYIQGWPSFTF